MVIRDRRLTAAQTLGLPLPDALDHALLADVANVVREHALARIGTVDAPITELERERCLRDTT